MNAIVGLLSLISLQLSAQNRVAQTNNIAQDYLIKYQSTMANIEGTLKNGSPESIKQLITLSGGKLSSNYLLSQSKKFKMSFKNLEDGGRPFLKPKSAGAEKWCEYTYFTVNANKTVTYFLQLKVVFVEENPKPISSLRIGDEVPIPKVKFLKVLNQGELSPPNSTAVLDALKEAGVFGEKVSSREFQRMMDSLMKK